MAKRTQHTFSLRLNAAQYRLLECLEKKLSVDKANLIRLAIARLAEAEGFIATQNAQTPHIVVKNPPTQKGA